MTETSEHDEDEICRERKHIELYISVQRKNRSNGIKDSPEKATTCLQEARPLREIHVITTNHPIKI